MASHSKEISNTCSYTLNARTIYSTQNKWCWWPDPSWRVVWWSAVWYRYVGGGGGGGGGWKFEYSFFCVFCTA